MFFGARCFKALNVQFYSKSFIQRCPSITLWRNNVSESVQDSFFCSVIIFIGRFDSRETSETKPSTFCVMSVPKMPQAAMPSSFKLEVKQISPFRLQLLRRFLLEVKLSLLQSYLRYSGTSPCPFLMQ